MDETFLYIYCFLIRFAAIAGFYGSFAQVFIQYIFFYVYQVILYLLYLYFSPQDNEFHNCFILSLVGNILLLMNISKSPLTLLLILFYLPK